MNFTMSRSLLISIAKNLARVVPSRTPNEELQLCRIEAQGGKVSFFATSGGTGNQATIDITTDRCTIEKSGQVALLAEKLFDSVSSLQSETVIVRVVGVGKVEITDGRDRFQWSTNPSSSVVNTEPPSSDDGVGLEGELLAEGIRNCLTITNPSIANQSCVWFKSFNNDLYIYAASTRGLCQTKVDTIEQGISFDAFPVPYQCAQLISEVFGKSDRVEFYCKDGHAVIFDDDTTLSFPIMAYKEGGFFDQVQEKMPANTFTASSVDLAQAFHSVGVASSESKAIRCDAKSEAVVLTGQSEIGDSTFYATIEDLGQPFSFCVNHELATKIIGCSGDAVVVGPSGDTISPVCFQSGNFTAFLAQINKGN